MRNVLLAIVMSVSSVGCLGSAVNSGNGSGGSSGNGGGTNGGGAAGSGGGSGGSAVDMSVDPAAVFAATVAPIMTSSCGVCHAAAGPTNAPVFMAPTPDMLTNILAFGAGLIGDTPADSLIYTKGNHEGPAFTADQLTTVGNWITMYNAAQTAAASSSDGGATAAPLLKPFAPSFTAANSIDLSAFSSKLAGMTMTFNAKMIGTSIQLSAITLKASATVGLHVNHPLFTTYDTTGVGTDDPIDSFFGLDETVNPGSSSPLGPGTLVLPNFPTGGTITVAFDKIETSTGTVATSTGCKALAMFVANVKPLITANCNTCHVGAAPVAGLAWDTTPDAALCAVALTEINLTTIASSNLLVKPDPSANGDAGHPKKINPFTAYQTAVTNWITAEK